MRKPIYFTLVTFEEGDHLGHLLALTCFVPHVLSISLFAILLSTPFREWRIKLGRALVGQFINEGFNLVLKRSIKEPRSFGERSDYAMPSSHAQYAGYIAVYGWRMCRSVQPTILRDFFRLVCIGIYVIVPFSRWYLEYHDLRQIFVGLTIGTIVGAFFY